MKGFLPGKKKVTFPYKSGKIPGESVGKGPRMGFKGPKSYCIEGLCSFASEKIEIFDKQKKKIMDKKPGASVNCLDALIRWSSRIILVRGGVLQTKRMILQGCNFKTCDPPRLFNRFQHRSVLPWALWPSRPLDIPPSQIVLGSGNQHRMN